MPRGKKTVKEVFGICNDCIYCTDPHELDVNGIPFLGKCKFEKHSVFLKNECENKHFSKKLS